MKEIKKIIDKLIAVITMVRNKKSLVNNYPGVDILEKNITEAGILCFILKNYLQNALSNSKSIEDEKVYRETIEGMLIILNKKGIEKLSTWCTEKLEAFFVFEFNAEETKNFTGNCIKFVQKIIGKENKATEINSSELKTGCKIKWNSDKYHEGLFLSEINGIKFCISKGGNGGSIYIHPEDALDFSYSSKHTYFKVDVTEDATKYLQKAKEYLYKKLYVSKYKPNNKNVTIETDLRNAVTHDDIEHVHYTIENGSDINDQNLSNQDTALHLALKKEKLNFAIIKILVGNEKTNFMLENKEGKTQKDLIIECNNDELNEILKTLGREDLYLNGTIKSKIV